MAVTPDQVARLRLIRSDQIGPVTYDQLVARFGSAQAAIDAIPDLAARGGGRPPRLASAAEPSARRRRWSAFGARYLFLGDGPYPALLAEAESTPPVLIAQGDLALLDRPAVAMVGARNASPPPAASRAARADSAAPAR